MSSTSTALHEFAGGVGPAERGPVVCVGGRTQWDLGGSVDAGTREVMAPAGVVAHEPGEMIVRVRAGTTLAELDAATASGGQHVALSSPHPSLATVGGVLASGQSGIRRLGWGPVRDVVLEVTAVTSRGELIRAGAPLVKNVTGFDLCRLLVGSLGTLAFIAEVVLRCRPLPEVERWWRSVGGADAGSAAGGVGSAGVDPFEVFASLYRPLSVLWDGDTTWVGLAGYAADVEAQGRAVLGSRFEPVDGPPDLPGPLRRSLAPAALAGIPGRIRSGRSESGPEAGGRWLAEIGVGVVHCDEAAAASIPVPPVSAGVVELHRRVKEQFDPLGRLAPGRSPLSPVGVGRP